MPPRRRYAIRRRAGLRKRRVIRRRGFKRRFALSHFGGASKVRRPFKRRKVAARRFRGKVRLPKVTGMSVLKSTLGEIRQPFEYEQYEATGSLVNQGQWVNGWGTGALNGGYTIQGSSESVGLPFAHINDPAVLFNIWANCITLLGDTYRFVLFNQVCRTNVTNMCTADVTINCYAWTSRKDCGTRASSVVTLTPTVPAEPGICTVIANGAQQDTENNSSWLSYMGLAVPRPYDVRRTVKNYKIKFVGKRTLRPGQAWHLTMRDHRPYLHDARDWFATSQSTASNYTSSMIQNYAATRFPPRKGFLFHVVGQLALGASSGFGYSHSLIYVHSHYSSEYTPMLASQPYLHPSNTSNIVGAERVFVLNNPTANSATNIS